VQEPRSRGVLYPARLPAFTRVPAQGVERELVVHFWIPEWDVEPGRVSRQHLIGYPASNLVVSADNAIVAGPTTRRSHRDLTGRGWAVGAMLRPAAVVKRSRGVAGRLATGVGFLMKKNKVSVIWGEATIEAPELVAAVTAAMRGAAPDRTTRAARALGDWLVDRVGIPTPDALLANELARLVDADPTVLHVGDIASRLGISERTVTRLAQRFVGLTPAAMIRRRRLQEAAERLRVDPSLPLAEVAAAHGYADQAHLTREFRAVLGFTPAGYRTDARASGRAASAQRGEAAEL